MRQKTIFLSFMGIGDNLMAFQAINNSRIALEDMVWVCKSDSLKLINTEFPKVPTFVIAKAKTDAPWRNLPYVLSVIGRLILFLRRHHCEKAVIFDYNWKPVVAFGIACSLAGIHKKIACIDKNFVKRFVKVAFSMKDYTRLHEVYRYTDMLYIAGLKKDDTRSNDEKCRISPLLQRRTDVGSSKGSRLVLIAPGSYRSFKRWHPENFRGIIKKLLETKYNVTLVGGAEDYELSEIILQGLDRKYVSNLCGEKDLIELALLMNDAALLITNDSAPMHLADYLGLPLIALFGVTDPCRCGPFIQRQNVICAEGTEAGSYSYGEFSCYDDSCINTITVNAVWNKIKLLLHYSRLHDGVAVVDQQGKG